MDDPGSGTCATRLSLTVEESADIFSPRHTRRVCGKTDRSAARHAGHVDPQGRLAGPFAWLRHSAAHPANFERTAGNSARFAVSRAVSARTPGLDRQRMG